MFAISSLWELIEFSVSLLSNKAASYVLSHQVDIWDTQWDMLMSLICATLALLLFNRFHDKKMKCMDKKDV